MLKFEEGREGAVERIEIALQSVHPDFRVEEGHDPGHFWSNTKILVRDGKMTGYISYLHINGPSEWSCQDIIRAVTKVIILMLLSD